MHFHFLRLMVLILLYWLLYLVSLGEILLCWQVSLLWSRIFFTLNTFFKVRLRTSIKVFSKRNFKQNYFLTKNAFKLQQLIIVWLFCIVFFQWQITYFQFKVPTFVFAFRNCYASFHWSFVRISSQSRLMFHKACLQWQFALWRTPLVTSHVSVNWLRKGLVDHSVRWCELPTPIME